MKRTARISPSDIGDYVSATPNNLLLAGQMLSPAKVWIPC